MKATFLDRIAVGRRLGVPYSERQSQAPRLPPCSNAFTERARRVVVLGPDEARALKHTVDKYRAQVARIVGEGDRGHDGAIPFTPSANNVLDCPHGAALARPQLEREADEGWISVDEDGTRLIFRRLRIP
jgi:hypothetical protein